MMNRRSFLLTTAGTLTSLTLSQLAMSTSKPSRAYRVGLIGTGWYGKSDLLRLMQVVSVEVVGLCDVDKNQLEEAKVLLLARRPDCRLMFFSDHLKMLELVKPDIVIIGTPDHWHALTCIDSLKAGAHVYVQKPISIDVIEGEAMVAAARKYNRVVQVGLQRRSTPHLIEVRDKFIKTGMLGKIKHVEMCCYYPMRAKNPSKNFPPPEYLDYERWVGPAPFRHYEGLPHRGWWRSYMEYSNGIMGDMCVHMFDTVRWLLQLGWPESISSTGGIFMDKESSANTADTQTAIFEYPELKCVWQHRTWGTAVNPDYPWAFTLYGDQGTLWASTTRYDFYPADGKKIAIHGDVLFEKNEYPEDLTEKDIELHCAPATRRHFVDFIRSIETGTSPVANILEGHISTASCILANISMQLRRPLSYDPITMTVKGDHEATQMLTRKYRAGWIHPHPSAV